MDVDPLQPHGRTVAPGAPSPTGRTGPAAPAASPAAAPVHITPALAFALVASVVIAVVLERAFVAAHRTIGWAVACSVVALLLDPVVQWLSRRLPRVVAIIVAVSGVVGVAVVVVARIISELMSSVRSLAREAPEAASRFEAHSRTAHDLHLTETIRGFTAQLSKDLSQETISRVKTAPTYLITGVLMLFLLVHGRRYLNGGLGLIHDPERRRWTRHVVAVGLTRGRNRLLAALLQVIVVTIVALVLFEALDLKASFILALLLGVSTTMPYVGVLVGGAPAAVMAYGFKGTGASIAVGVLVAVVEVVDVRWWKRRCDRRTVEVGLFLPLVASLVGYQLYRVGGAIYGYSLVVLALALVAAADMDRDRDVTTWGGPAEEGRAGPSEPDPALGKV